MDFKEKHNKLRKKYSSLTIIFFIVGFTIFFYSIYKSWYYIGVIFLIVPAIINDIVSKVEYKEQLKFKEENKDLYINSFCDNYLKAKNFHYELLNNHEEVINDFKQRFKFGNISCVLSFKLDNVKIAFIEENYLKYRETYEEYKYMWIKAEFTKSIENNQEIALLIEKFKSNYSKRAAKNVKSVDNILYLPISNHINNFNLKLDNMYDYMENYDKAFELILNINQLLK